MRLAQDFGSPSLRPSMCNAVERFWDLIEGLSMADIICIEHLPIRVDLLPWSFAETLPQLDSCPGFRNTVDRSTPTWQPASNRHRSFRVLARGLRADVNMTLQQNGASACDPPVNHLSATITVLPVLKVFEFSQTHSSPIHTNSALCRSI